MAKATETAKEMQTDLVMEKATDSVMGLDLVKETEKDWATDLETDSDWVKARGWDWVRDPASDCWRGAVADSV